MDNTKRITKSQILTLILFSIIPVLVVLLGLVLLIKNNALTNITFMLAFVILPVLAISLIALVSFICKKRSVKMVLSILILILFAGSFLVVGFLGEYEELSLYENDEMKSQYTQNNKLMPALSELSHSEKVEYYDYFSAGLMGIFTWDVDALICEYDEDEYLIQKDLLDKKYVFQSDFLNACDPTTINGYFFRMLSKDEYKLNYPKEVVLVATNDEKKEIVYMSFFDEDRDYIESLDEFITDDCGWKYIR